MGVIDETPINLSQKPAVDGEVFFDRKSRYTFNLQLVCDERKLIRYCMPGWPGSVFDQTVFSTSELFYQPEHHFSQNEFLLADSGYSLTKYCCTPYRQPAASTERDVMFNELFSTARVLIEHVNGILKARWSSLREIRTEIRKKEDIERINNHIICCAILYNLATLCKDEWNEELLEQPDENPNVGGGNELPNGNLREEVQDRLLEWYNEKH